MSTIPGPIVEFGFSLEKVQAQINGELSKLKTSFDRTNKQVADKFASDFQVAVAKTRAAITSGGLGLPQIQVEQKKLIALADQEIARLKEKARLTVQELAQLKRATLERERFVSALASGTAVGVTAGTQAAVDKTAQSFQQLTAAQQDAAQKAVLIAQQLGITLPTAMQKLIVQSGAATAAIRGLFFIGVGSAAVAAVATLLPKVGDIVDKVRDWHGLQKLQIAAQEELNRNYVETGNRIQQIAADIRAIGATPLQRAADEAIRTAANFAKAQDRVRFLREEVKRLEEVSRETEIVRGPRSTAEVRTVAAVQADKELIDTRKALTIAERDLTVAQLESSKAALLVAQNSASLTTERERGERAAKSFAEAEKRLNEIQSQNLLSLQKLAAEPGIAALNKLRERFRETAVDLNAQARDIPILGVPDPEDFARRQAGLDALTKINEQWLRSTGQTVALIQLEYERDLQSFQDIARAKRLTAEERAEGELKIEQIKNEKLKEERKKEFAELRRSAEQLFDAAFQGAKSFGDTFRRILQAAILAPFREVFADLVAKFLGPLQSRLRNIFTGGRLGSPTAPGGTGTFSGKPIPGLGGGTVAVPANTAQVNTASATIASLAAMTVSDVKLMTVQAKTVILSGQPGGGTGGAASLLGLFFGSGQQQGGSGSGGLFDVIFRGQQGGGSGTGSSSASGGPFSKGNLTGTLANIGLGAVGLVSATKATSKSQAILTGAISGAQIGGSILPGIGHAIGAGLGALFGSFFGGKSKAEIFEERVQKALKRQTAAAKLLVSDPFAFRFANLDTLSDTFGSTFADVQGGGFIASRPGVTYITNHNERIEAVDTASFEEMIRRRSGAVNRAMAFGGSGRFGTVLQQQFEPA